jgi:hypothetical protein
MRTAMLFKISPALGKLRLWFKTTPKPGKHQPERLVNNEANRLRDR